MATRSKFPTRSLIPVDMWYIIIITANRDVHERQKARVLKSPYYLFTIMFILINSASERNLSSQELLAKERRGFLLIRYILTWQWLPWGRRRGALLKETNIRSFTVSYNRIWTGSPPWASSVRLAPCGAICRVAYLQTHHQLRIGVVFIYGDHLSPLLTNSLNRGYINSSQVRWGENVGGWDSVILQVRLVLRNTRRALSWHWLIACVRGYKMWQVVPP